MSTSESSLKANKALWTPTLAIPALVLRVSLWCLAAVLIRDALSQFASIDWAWAGQGDAAVDWAAAKLYWQGISPYTPEGLAQVGVPAFGHPPTTPFWFLPWTELSHQGFARSLGLLNLGLSFVLVGIVVRTLRLPSPSLLTALVFGAVQSTPAALEHAQVIQISVWIAFAYVLAWRWLRQGQSCKAGVALGLACTLKLFPGLVVLYFLVTRRFALVLSAIAAYLLVAAIMTYRWGISSWLLFFQQQGGIARKWLLDIRNASLNGVVRRAFGEHCQASVYDETMPQVVALTLAAVLLGLCFFTAWRATKRQPRQIAFDRSFGLFSVLSAYLNPWIWEHYFYLLILPALIIFRSILDDWGRCYRSWLIGQSGHVRMTIVSGLAFAGAVPLAVSWEAYNHHYNTAKLAERLYCSLPQQSLSKPWLLDLVEHFGVLNWLPWPAYICVLLALLSIRIPADPLESSKKLFPKQLNSEKRSPTLQR